MNTISYNSAEYPVRENYAEGHNRYWGRLARAGSWFTGKEKVDIAREVRNAHFCELCKRRKQALSPGAVQGEHDRVTDLPEVIVDVIHRVITDPNRLTKSFFDEASEQGITAGQYIEIIGTAVHVFMIDEFCRAIGVPLNELPEPVEGEPSQYVPGELIDVGAWVKVLPETFEPDSPEADLSGRIPFRVFRTLSLVPDEVRTILDLIEIHYLSGEEIGNLRKGFGGTLSRYQKEVVATRVSSFNDCYYCTSGHAEMLDVSIWATDGGDIDISGITDPACKEIPGIPYSTELIEFSDAFMAKDVDRLEVARESLSRAMSPEAMVDAAGIVSNFQRMNRLADSTGMPLEEIGIERADDRRDQRNTHLGIDQYGSAVNTLGA